MGREPTSPELAASLLGESGWQTGLRWSTPQAAAELAGKLASFGGVVLNPHLTLPEINVVVRNPQIIEAVSALIGPDVGIEGTFLMTKMPGIDFEVPWHQDGISAPFELDPERSVTLWAALTDATVANGTLRVIPGSHRHGYLGTRYDQDAAGEGRGKPLRTDVPAGSPDPIVVPVAAGQALLLDVRLLHASPSNTGTTARVGLNVRYVAPGAIHAHPGHQAPSPHPIIGTGW